MRRRRSWPGTPASSSWLVKLDWLHYGPLDVLSLRRRVSRPRRRVYLDADGNVVAPPTPQR